MSAANLVREPNGSGCVIAHASSLRDFGLFADLASVLPEAFGLVVISPPDQLSPYRCMDSLVTDQANELRGLIPANTSVLLLGDCMAGHITLNMALQLISHHVTIRKIVLLDTLPLEAYFEAGVFDLLTIPGKAESFGSLGARLLELDEQRKSSSISMEAWAEETFEAMSNQRDLLAEGLQQPLNLPLADTEEIAEFLIDWARFAGLVLASSPIKYAGPATLLISPEMNELLSIVEAWKPTLPKIQVEDAKIRHLDITMSPMIAEALIRLSAPRSKGLRREHRFHAQTLRHLREAVSSVRVAQLAITLHRIARVPERLADVVRHCHGSGLRPAPAVGVQQVHEGNGIRNGPSLRN